MREQLLWGRDLPPIGGISRPLKPRRVKKGDRLLKRRRPKKGYNDFYIPKKFFRRRTFLHFLDEKIKK